MNMEVTLTSQNFDEEVLKYKGKVLVDFWAPWCGPCQIMGPILEEFAKEAPANVKVGKLNVDDYRELAQRYNIMSIPTLMVFTDGKVTAQVSGVQDRAGLEKLLGLG